MRNEISLTLPLHSKLTAWRPKKPSLIFRRLATESTASRFTSRTKSSSSKSSERTTTLRLRTTPSAVVVTAEATPRR